MKKLLLSLAIVLAGCLEAQAQLDSLFNRKPMDTTRNTVNQDAIFNRPFIYMGRSTTAVGGYLEGNTNYWSTEGVSEGFSMELRRFNIFLFSTIAKRIRFLAELEFEHGTQEIGLETALVDFEVNPAFNFRTGILVAPIGAFNLKHDSPLWEFIDRPLVSTQLIPSTLSEVGFGIHGKFFGHQKVFTYDAYIVNGLADDIIFNEEGRTFLPAGKSAERFGKDNNGVPMLTGKLGFRHRKIGEVGLSYYGGVYNTFKSNGTVIDEKRRMAIYALDFNTRLGKATVNGEFALVTVEVPAAAGQFFGKRQQGGYVEVVWPVLKRTMLNFENTVLNLNLRLESIDYNVNTFQDSGATIYDHVRAVVGGISLRPSANTVLRANYRYHWSRDFVGTPTSRTVGIQVGFASYF